MAMHDCMNAGSGATQQAKAEVALPARDNRPTALAIELRLLCPTRAGAVYCRAFLGGSEDIVKVVSRAALPPLRRVVVRRFLVDVP